MWGPECIYYYCTTDYNKSCIYVLVQNSLHNVICVVLFNMLVCWHSRGIMSSAYSLPNMLHNQHIDLALITEYIFYFNHGFNIFSSQLTKTSMLIKLLIVVQTTLEFHVVEKQELSFWCVNLCKSMCH